VAFAGYAAFYTQWGGSGLAGRFWLATRGIIISEVFFIVYFRLFHTYSGVIRYSSMMDLIHVALATLIGTTTTYLLGLLATWQEWSAVCFPKALGCLEMFLVATVLMWIERILVKYL
jgi:FlaA1/EpsC-like NDP-sugar epimerase